MISNNLCALLVLLFSQIIFSKPLYDISKTFEENFAQEYLDRIQNYSIPSRSHWSSLFGYPLASPLGVPACAIMTSKGITLASKLGFNVLTYKTIRNHSHAGLDYPNMCYVDCDHQLTTAEIGGPFHILNEQRKDFLALSNSFGISSSELDWLKKDIAKARASLSEGQILIVSVLGSATETKTIEQDFAATAKFAYEAGAHIIEINLSCPNIDGGLLYKNPELIFTIVNKVFHEIPIPIIIKLGTFDSSLQMRASLKAAALAGARGICGINAVPIKVITRDNKPFFGSDRAISGLSGDPIRMLALQYITDAYAIIQEEKLDLVIFATGGITKHEHFQYFFDAGATVAMSATGMIWNPYLAVEYYAARQEKNSLHLQQCTNIIGKKLFEIMYEKQTNLALAADVTTKAELLALADLIGPEICILKTHIDIITDFDWDLILQLQALAQKHNFLLCEDRKFADVGTTVQMQYTGGMYHIEQWADIIIAHALFGPSIIDALQHKANSKPHGLLLLAQLSTNNNLITNEYTKSVVEMGLSHPDFVIGFICQEQCTDDPRFIHITPGVNFSTIGSFNQGYNTPERVIKERKSDIIIVGKGIYNAPNPLAAAQEYRHEGWTMYKQRYDIN